MADFDFSCPIPSAPADLESRTAALHEALEERILVLDGGTGTFLQTQNLSAADFGGPEFEGCNELLCVTRPDVIDRLHEGYLAAGADVVECNSFGSTPLVLAEYAIPRRAFELSKKSAELARAAAKRHDAPGRLRFVCGDMGPTTKAISVTGGVTYEELQNHFRVQTLGLMAGGADYLLLETCQDTRNIKAGLIGIETAFAQAGWRIPVAVSVTIETTGTMLAGQDAEALAVSLLHADLLYVGVNCATGPELMRDHVRTLSELCRTRVAIVPNAGLPDENGKYTEGPEVFEKVIGDFIAQGWVNLTGGCCGTGPAHVRTLAALARGKRPRALPHHARALVSGLEAVEVHPDNRPLLVGERTNVLGSKKFKTLIAEGQYEAAAEVGRDQVKSGAQILDVCLQDPDRDERVDMDRLLEKLTRLVKAPFMIDTTDAAVMERALTWCQGRAVLNSINLEDGEKRFREVVPLARKYGAALVVGCIDEKGMAVTVERKLEVARRSFELLTEKYGIAPEEIWWDALVFPCGTGDSNYIGSAGLTVEGIRALKNEFPETKSVLGVSNVSFGLPPAGREILNSVFLYHCTKAGLDAAIVNSERLARFAEIPETDRALAEKLIFLTPGGVAAADAAVAEFTAHFRGRQRAAGASRAELPLEQRISRAVIEGSKQGLIEDLEAARADARWPTPLDLINGPLMAGMAEVGKLFNANQLIVAEVLQSAEVMKAAVTHLEQFMEKSASATRGTVLLATVKGDVHDIGKNLVDIVLSNNGFKVANLGIKVPSEQLIQGVLEHKPDVIGLSGLLVKSAQQMVLTAGDMKAAGISTPLLVGGAALTRKFTHRKIAAAYGGFCTYANDAMDGLRLVEQLTNPGKRPELESAVEKLIAQDAEPTAAESGIVAEAAAPAPVRRDLVAPPPPDLEFHERTLDADAVWPLINPQVLYGRHMGLKGSVREAKEKGDEKYLKLKALFDGLKQEGRSGGMTIRARWRFFPARAEGNAVILTEPGTNREAARWEFPRQRGEGGLCLSDHLLPDDHVALFVTTAGGGVRERVERYKRDGEYLKSHAWAALALESAEAAAEWVHRELRSAWGFPDPASLSDQDLFAARYRGKRYSFGYPACPDLAFQRELFGALRPASIGVTLTEGDMMEPEASVSALVFQHPDARYFAV